MDPRASFSVTLHDPPMQDQAPHDLIGAMIQRGTIASVDHASATCTVTLGDITSGPLPWFCGRAGGVILWSPPSIGEQVAILACEGDLDNGLVLCGLYSDAFPPPATSPAITCIQFPDGAKLSYDHAAHHLAFALSEGTLNIAAAAITLNGDVTVNGTVTASGDVVGAGVSLSGHRHGNVQSGTAQSGPPA